MRLRSLLQKLQNEDGAYLIEASVITSIVIAVMFVILIVMLNVIQSSHLEGLAQDSLNYAIERSGTTLAGGWGRGKTLQANLRSTVERYIRQNTNYTVVHRTPKTRDEVYVRAVVNGGQRQVTLYLTTVNAGYFGDETITVKRGGQLGQEWVRGMGDNP